MIKSYRGLIADGTQDTIPLHTNDGKTGYKIVKFELMANDPSGDNAENVIEIWKVKQNMATLTDKIDFTQTTLLAAGYVENHAGEDSPMSISIMFDNEVFNQDIYVTNVAGLGSTGVNYYIELEQISLTEDQALVAIVKNLRNEQ